MTLAAVIVRTVRRAVAVPVDGVAAFLSLLDSGADPASIAFAGDSAGGGLAVTTCLAALTRHLHPPLTRAA